MISPLGTFVTRMDTTVAGSVDGLIAAMTSSMATPVALAAVSFYAVQGLRLANGDPAPLQGFVPQLIRVGVVIWLSSNLSAFNFWVRDVFFTGLPNWLAASSGSAIGITATGPAAVGAVFDGLWNGIWEAVGTLWRLGGAGVSGFVSGVCGWLTGIFCGAALVVLALIYISARLVLAVVICISPVLIGCAMFDVTKPIFERGVGVVVSLIAMQTLGFVIMEILLLGDQWFMAQATTRIIAAATNTDAFYEALASLAGLVVWFLAGAYAMKHIPQVAYSIGGGITLGGNPLTWLLLARGLGRGSSGPSVAGGGAAPSPNLRLDMAPPQLPGSPSTPPPPPPPSISQSTRR